MILKHIPNKMRNKFEPQNNGSYKIREIIVKIVEYTYIQYTYIYPYIYTYIYP